MLQAAGGRHADDEHPAYEHVRGGKPQPAGVFERQNMPTNTNTDEHELHAVVMNPSISVWSTASSGYCAAPHECSTTALRKGQVVHHPPDDAE